ncbi:FG-GAP-like repeat-containing protein [Fulvivirga ligni]|uniref:FG-GAP-like repeat-containing protein n=1 Tax=Fulvivirga ligni TaxID=2904246 RepID=UPI001F2F36E9|nr:FG-GAP-like repeat-containing protein [Fulvivirga ligni]UII19369.1 FG-GAP-like repeat-containing protein [Fulvivirga ligni]
MKIFTYHKRITFFTFCLLLVSSIVLAQTPIITNVSPNSGYAGQTITITGSNFNASSQVSFGDARGNVISRTTQIIEVQVPANATFDHITVTNSNDLSGFSTYPFLLSYGGESGLVAADFGAELTFATQASPYDLEVSDFNNDGKNDIITTSATSGVIQILQNTTVSAAAPTFGTPILHTLSPSGTSLNITAADLNGDSKPEIIVSEDNDNDPRSRVFVLTNTSGANVSFAPASYVLDIPGAQTKKIDVMDIDMDGKPDLVITDQSNNGRLAIARNTSSAGSISFDLANITFLSLSSSVKSAPLEVADFNNDGKPDVAASLFFANGGSIYLFKNNSTPGNISFSTATTRSVTGSIVNLKAADINNDGKLDLIATNFLAQSALYFLNNSTTGGALSFGNQSSISADQRPWGLDVSDFNGDGEKDIVIANSDAAIISVLHQTAPVTFQTVNINVSGFARNVKSGDINGDGKPDIVFTRFNANSLGILINQKCIKPVLNEEGPLVVCASNPLELEAQSVSGATYNWYMDGMLQQSGPSNTYSVNTVGVHNYTVELIQGVCAEMSDPVSVEVKSGSLPTATIISPTSDICLGGTATLQVDIAADQYIWTGPNGFSATGNPVTVADFRPSNVGVYQVDLYSGDCLAATETINVETVDVPTFTVTSSPGNQLCQGSSATLTISPSNNTNYSYQWATEENGNISGETGSSLTVSTVGSKNYFVKIEDLNNASCPDIESNVLNVSILQSPSAVITAPNQACAGQNIQFTSNSSVDANATVQYKWNFGDAAISTDENPKHAYGTAGNFTVSLEVSYSGVSGCTSSITKPIEILNGGTVEIVSSNDPICEGEATTLSLTDTYESYSWNTGQTSSEIVITEAGTYTVEVETNGCLLESSISLNSFPQPVVSITADSVSVAPGSTVQLTASGLENYSWSPKESLNDPSIPNPIATVDISTTYTVSGTDINGCTGSQSIDLFTNTDLIGNIIRPKNFFSPNSGDDINNFWVIEKIEQFPECQVTVVDQTGNIIMEASPYQNDWDGTYNGKDLPPGAYYYIIKCDGQEIVKSGSITLLR